MGPAKAIGTAVRRSLDWTGRSDRAEFWWFFAFCWALTLVLPALPQETPALFWTALAIRIFWWFLILPFFALAVRRLRDAGFWPGLLLLPLALIASREYVQRIWLPGIDHAIVTEYLRTRPDLSLPFPLPDYSAGQRLLARTILPWLSLLSQITVLLLMVFPGIAPRRAIEATA